MSATEPPFISAVEPHDIFHVRVTCVTCGWEDWGYEGPVYESMRAHTEETSHA